MQRSRLGAIALGTSALLGAALASPALAATETGTTVPTFQEFHASTYQDADNQYIVNGDEATTSRLIRDFFMPYLKIRNGGKGYAVSIVKAGMRVVGKPAGPVRSPLTDLNDEETAELKRILVGALGDAIH